MSSGMLWKEWALCGFKQIESAPNQLAVFRLLVQIRAIDILLPARLAEERRQGTLSLSVRKLVRLCKLILYLLIGNCNKQLECAYQCGLVAIF